VILSSPAEDALIQLGRLGVGGPEVRPTALGDYLDA
jgi:hypothetical protein